MLASPVEGMDRFSKRKRSDPNIVYTFVVFQKMNNQVSITSPPPTHLFGAVHHTVRMLPPTILYVPHSPNPP